MFLHSDTRKIAVITGILTFEQSSFTIEKYAKKL